MAIEHKPNPAKLCVMGRLHFCVGRSACIGVLHTKGLLS